MTKTAFFLWTLRASLSHGLEILPVEETAHFQVAPISMGSVAQSLIPFNLDFLAIPNRTQSSVVEKYRTATWESRVAVYDNGNFIESYASLGWNPGEGPGANLPDAAADWNACVIAIPDLFGRLAVTGQGNGSCFDVAENLCLNTLVSVAQARFKISLDQVHDVDSDEMKLACRRINELPLAPGCFRDQQSSNSIPVFPSFNPRNNQPFMMGVDEHSTGAADKAEAEKTAVSRVWSFIILEAQGKEMITSALSCPYAGLHSSQRDIQPTIDGTCGGLSRHSCTGTSIFFGNCCSSSGFCGYSEDDCFDSFGCQSEYGLCDTIVTVTEKPQPTTSVIPQPTAGFYIRTFEHQVCDGRVHNVKEVEMGEDVCITTDCQVGGLDTSGAGLCPDGEIQISYWENAGCSGKWYGYEYTSRNSCKALWSQGWKFKSLHLRCTARKGDCLSKKECTADPEPALGICQAPPPPKPAFDFSVVTHRNADCSGSIHDSFEVKQGTNGFCVNTNCQVGSFDIASAGACADGHIQISYWEQADCRGEWYGYGYSSRQTCRTLWSGGTKFKSVWIKCYDPTNDCVNQGSCTMDPEPSEGKC